MGEKVTLLKFKLCGFGVFGVFFQLWIDVLQAETNLTDVSTLSV